MKRNVFFKFPMLAAAFCFFCISCASLKVPLEYLGDTYPASKVVDVFYEATQIKKEYKIMGRVIRETLIHSEKTRKRMIELAKTRGADGILFSDFVTKTYDSSCYGIIRATLIKYKD